MKEGSTLANNCAHALEALIEVFDPEDNTIDVEIDGEEVPAVPAGYVVSILEDARQTLDDYWYGEENDGDLYEEDPETYDRLQSIESE